MIEQEIMRQLNIKNVDELETADQLIWAGWLLTLN